MIGLSQYCVGPTKQKVTVMLAKAETLYRKATADWAPAFARVTNSNIIGAHQ